MKGLKLLRQRQKLKEKAKLYNCWQKFLEVYNSKRNYVEPIKRS